MATRTTTLRVALIDDVSGPGAAAGRALNQLGIGATNFKGILGSLGIALGAAQMARFGKEAIEAYAEHERGLERLANVTGMSATALQKLHERLVQIAKDAALPAPAVENLESTLNTMTRMGMSLEQSMKALPEVARLAVTAGVEVTSLAKLAPMLIRSLHIAPADLTKAFDAMYEASKHVPGGLTEMVSGLEQILPQVDRIGWRSQEGLNKLLSYIAGLAPALGGAAPAFAGVAESIGTMTTKRLQDRFTKAGVDINRILVEARQRGEDEFAAFIRGANEAINNVALGRVTLSKEQQEWFHQVVLQQGEIAKRYKELQASQGIVARDNATITEDSQAKINRLATAWKEFKQDLGAALVGAGVIEYLDKLRTQLEGIIALLPQLKTPEQYAHEHAQYFRENLPAWIESFTHPKTPLISELERQRLAGVRPGETQAEHAARTAPGAVPLPLPAPPRPPVTSPPPAPPISPGVLMDLGRPRAKRPAPPPIERLMPPPPEPAPLDLTGAFDTMPDVAKSAGQATGQAYNAALGTELNKSVGMIRQFTDWAGKALGFRASPQIAPSFETAPGTQGPGSRASMLSRGAFSDSGPVPTH